MKVLIQTAGSRGDVEPYLALGQGLVRAGHEVIINTSDRFQGVVGEAGLDYAFMNSGLVDLLDTEIGRGALEDLNNVYRAARTIPRLVRESSDIQRRMIAEGWSAADALRPDIIVFNSKMAGAHYAEKLGIPAVLAMPLPQFVPTGDFPTLGFPESWRNRTYNRMSYRLLHFAANRIGARWVNEWRLSQGLPRSAGLGLLQRSDGQPVPVLHGFSEQVVPRPGDWPAHAQITGYWFLDRPDNWAAPDDLSQFVDKGAPPVHVGFGSMAGRDPARTTATVLDALARTGRRCVLVTGWGGLAPVDTSDDIFVVEAVRYDWLMPRVAATVHHGGAGTTAAGLRAGRPTVICPFFGDQPFWGRRLCRLGLGPAPIPQKKLTAATLAQAIDTACDDSAMRQRAREIGERIRGEDGVGRAVALLESTEFREPAR